MQEEDDGSQLDSTSSSTTSTEDTEGSEDTPPWDDELGSVPVLGDEVEDRLLSSVAAKFEKNVHEPWWDWYDRQIKSNEDWTHSNSERGDHSRPIEHGSYAYRFWLQMKYEEAMGNASLVLLSPKSQDNEESRALLFFNARVSEFKSHLADLFSHVTFDKKTKIFEVKPTFPSSEEDDYGWEEDIPEKLDVKDKDEIWQQHRGMYFFKDYFSNLSANTDEMEFNLIKELHEQGITSMETVQGIVGEERPEMQRFLWVSRTLVRTVFECTRIQKIGILTGQIDGKPISPIKLSSLDVNLVNLVKDGEPVHYDEELHRVMDEGTNQTIEITDHEIELIHRYRILRRDLVLKVANRLQNSIWLDDGVLADQNYRFRLDPYLWLAGDLIYLLTEMGWLAASDGDFFDVLEGEEFSEDQQDSSGISRKGSSDGVRSYPGMLEFTGLQNLMDDDNEEKDRRGGRWGHAVLRYYIGERQRWMWCQPIDHESGKAGGLIGRLAQESLDENHQVKLRFHGRRHHYFTHILKRKRCEEAQPTIDALNHLQKTEWEINVDLLKAIIPDIENATTTCPEIASCLGKNPDGGLVNDSILREISKMRHSAWKIIRIHHPSLGKPGQRKQLTPMRESSQHPSANRFWHSWFCDWRGRLYPRSTELSPHSMDLGKALIRFKQKLPLGERGVHWLRIHLCNLYSGVAKEWKKEKLALPSKLQDSVVRNFTQRREWSEYKKVKERLHQIAENPLSEDNINLWYEGWGAGRESFQRLAATLEFKKVLDAESEGEDPAEVKSGLPIHLDATTNAYQHMAALSRDPELARLVNIISGEPPEDLYIKVSQKALERYEEDCKNLNTEGYSPQTNLLNPNPLPGTRPEDMAKEKKCINDIIEMLTVDDHGKDLVEKLFDRSVTKLPIMTVAYGGKEASKALLSHNGKSSGRLGHYWYTDDSVTKKQTWHPDSKLYRVFTEVFDKDEVNRKSKTPIPNKIAHRVVGDIKDALSLVAPGYKEVQDRLKNCLIQAKKIWFKKMKDEKTPNPGQDELLNWETPSQFHVWNFEPTPEKVGQRNLRFRTRFKTTTRPGKKKDTEFYYWRYFREKHRYWVNIINKLTEDEYTNYNEELLEIGVKAAEILKEAESLFTELTKPKKGIYHPWEKIRKKSGLELQTKFPAVPDIAQENTRLKELKGDYPHKPAKHENGYRVLSRKFDNWEDAVNYRNHLKTRLVRKLIHELNSRCTKQFSAQDRIPRDYMELAIDHRNCQTNYFKKQCKLFQKRHPDHWINTPINSPSRMLDKNLPRLFQAWVDAGGEMDPDKDDLVHAAALYQIKQYKMGTMKFDYDLEEPRWEKETKEEKKLRMVSGLTANFVHSMDAAHLTLVVNEMAIRSSGDSDSDIERAFKDVWVVHDSFGTHACAIDEMRKIVRQKFIEVHSTDHLHELEKEYKVKPVHNTNSEERWEIRIWKGIKNVDKYWTHNDLELRSLTDLQKALKIGVSPKKCDSWPKNESKVVVEENLLPNEKDIMKMKEQELKDEMFRVREMIRSCQDWSKMNKPPLEMECKKWDINHEGMTIDEMQRKLISAQSKKKTPSPTPQEFSEICDDPWESEDDPSNVHDYMIS